MISAMAGEGILLMIGTMVVVNGEDIGGSLFRNKVWGEVGDKLKGANGECKGDAVGEASGRDLANSWEKGSWAGWLGMGLGLEGAGRGERRVADDGTADRTNGSVSVTAFTKLAFNTERNVANNKRSRSRSDMMVRYR